jgi:hypothetical protein
MRKYVIACLALVALVACSSNRAESAKASYETSFSSDTPDLLLVEVDDDQPVTAARLAAPDGTFYEAYAIDTDRQSGGSSPGIFPSEGVGVSGGSSSNISTGVGLSFPIFGASGPAPRPHYRSTARIRVTDMAAYRANWEKSEVRLTMGEGSSAHEIVLRAPKPAAQ